MDAKKQLEEGQSEYIFNKMLQLQSTFIIKARTLKRQLWTMER